MKMSSQSGLSIVEVLVAIGILAINMMALTTFWINTKTIIERAKTVGQRETLSTTIVQDIKAQVEGYQIFFDNSPAVESEALQIENLSMRWNGLSTVDKELCLNCKGKLGFLIQPYGLPGDDVTYRGMFRAVIKYQHDDLEQIGKTKEFLFVSK